MSDPRHELAKVADGGGPAAGAARTALGGGAAATRLRAAILALAQHRGPKSSICPSDAARAVGGEDWRDLNDESRSIALDLARDGEVDITQRGESVDPDPPLRGPIRIRMTVADAASRFEIRRSGVQVTCYIGSRKGSMMKAMAPGAIVIAAAHVQWMFSVTDHQHRW